MDAERDASLRSGNWSYRIPLRVKTEAVVWAPMAALVVALLGLFWGETAVSRAEQALIEAQQDRARILDQIRGALDREAFAIAQLRAGASSDPLERARAVTDRLRAAERIQKQRLDSARLERDAALRRLLRVLLACGIFGPALVLLIDLLGAATLVRRLRASESRYRELFDRAPIPYEETDSQGIVRRFNQEVCALLKCGPERIYGSAAWDFVDPEQRESYRTAMLERIAGGVEAGPFECELLLGDGSRIVVEIRESLIRNGAGRVTGVCRSLLDVTERKLAADAKSRFLANVSHELRTPLNGIIGFSELLYDGKAGPLDATHRDMIGDILSSARHLLHLVSDVLDLSNVEAGRMEFHPESSSLDPLVREVCEVLQPLAERKQIRLLGEVPEGFAAVLDRARFKQILYNYLSNAVKFTPDGGTVWIRILPSEHSFRLEVEDTGVGILPEETSLLFQDFQQLSNRRLAGQGTGLGLALTRHIVEAQGGTVGVRSTPGAGSVFFAVLPLRPGNSASVSVG